METCGSRCRKKRMARASYGVGSLRHAGDPDDFAALLVFPGERIRDVPG